MIDNSLPGHVTEEDPSHSGLKDKRRSRRVLVNLPVKVRGTNAKGVNFEEMTHSIDVSSGGALILLTQPLSKGMSLELSLPMPPGARNAGSLQSVYHTAAKVIRIGPGERTGDFRVRRKISEYPLQKVPSGSSVASLS